MLNVIYYIVFIIGCLYIFIKILMIEIIWLKGRINCCSNLLIKKFILIVYIVWIVDCFKNCVYIYYVYFFFKRINGDM